MNSEISRIKRIYKLRKERGISWSIWQPENHFIQFELQRKFIEAFKLCGVDKENISTKKLLDAGCGDAKLLRWFQDLGFKSLFGIDILDWEIINAQRINPTINFFLGSISNLPFKSNYFDFVILSTVFSSILDDKFLKDYAQECFRVLAPGGAIILQDTRKFEGRRSRLIDENYLRCIKKDDLIKLFPEAEINFSFCLVNPLLTGVVTSIINRGLLRSILRTTPFMNKESRDKHVLMLKFPYCLVEIIKYFGFLNTHVFAIIKKVK